MALNFSHRPRRYRRPAGSPAARLLASTYLDRQDERVAGAVELRADEGVVLGPEPYFP
jgi:hypothetical protein